MIEPISEVPEKALKMVNGRRLSLTAFSVIMILDKPAEELGIKDYSIFIGDTMDTDELYKDLAGLGPYRYLTCICHNYGNPDATPAGTCSFSITTLPRVDGWKTVTADEYDAVKHRVAEQMIDDMSKYYGVNLRDHILEIVIETPMTVAHYTGMWNGCITTPACGTAASTATPTPWRTTSWQGFRPPTRRSSSRGWSSPAPTRSPATAWAPP